MAATISDLANGISVTNNTTCATGATVTAAVGDWLVVIAASSNDGASGAASQSGVVDGDGLNTYTQRALINYDPGAAGAGATLGIYTCSVTNALSGDTITVNHSGNTSEKAVQVYRVQPGASETISFIAADATGSTGNATAHTAATVSVASGDIIFGGAAIETDDAVSGDTDTTNGNWSSVLTRLADNGADAATMSCASQYKTTTGAGNQDWQCDTSSGRDSARSYLVLRSAVAATTVTKTASLGALLQKQSVLRTTSLQALLQKQGVLRTASLNALLQKQGNLSATSLQALLQRQGALATAALGALLFKAGDTRSASLNALLQKLGVPRSSSLDAVLVRQTLITAALDALLKKEGETRSASLNALLQKLGVLRTSSLDAVLVRQGAVTTALQALLQKQGNLSAASLDAVVQQQGLLRTALLQALIQRQGVTTAASLNALLARLGVTATASLDALLARNGLTRTASLDALLRKEVTRTAALGAALLKQGVTRTALLDAFIGGEAQPGDAGARNVLWSEERAREIVSAPRRVIYARVNRKRELH